jgi:ankyrin repeat protein
MFFKSLLYLAIVNGHREVVRILLDAGANLLTIDSLDRTTPLIWALDAGYVGVAEFLVEKGADIFTPTEEGKTAFLIAVEGGYRKIVDLLLSRDKELVHRKDGEDNTSLMVAAQEGHLSLVKFLLKAGVSIDSRNAFGETALILASREGRLSVVEFLIAEKAEVNIRNRHVVTALAWCIYHRQLPLISKLLEAGADIHLKDGSLKTPVMILAEQPENETSLEILKLLAQRGALEGDVGQKAYQIAQEHNNHLLSQAMKEYLEQKNEPRSSLERGNPSPPHRATHL